MSRTYAEDWTERQHWSVMVVESPGELRCAGHWPHRDEASAQAARLRARGERAYVDEVKGRA